MRLQSRSIASLALALIEGNANFATVTLSRVIDSLAEMQEQGMNEGLSYQKNPVPTLYAE